MANSQDIAVARAVFVSALLRSEPDAPEVSRDDATLFARTILRTCNICTTSNIKLCKSFIIKYILASGPRTTALLKYLVSLSKSFGPRDPDARVDTTKPDDDNEGLGKIVNGKVQQPPEPAFKRLHVLYILHDALVHYTKHNTRHVQSEQRNETLEQLFPEICKLSELAACEGGGKATGTYRLVQDLLSFWSTHRVFTQEQLSHMRAIVTQAEASEWDAMLTKLVKDEESRALDWKRQREDETKWILPQQHGVIDDPYAPWHELPAANGLYLKRTRGYPLRANAFLAGGMPLQNGGKEADADLKNDVSNLYNEVIRCHDKYTNADEVQDVDALGNIIWKDPNRPTRNYWGFTLDGIDRRKELAERFSENSIGYEGLAQPFNSHNAIERARALAADRARGMGRGRGTPRRGTWRGSERW